MEDSAPYYCDTVCAGDACPGEDVHRLKCGGSRASVHIVALGTRMLIVLEGEPTVDTVVDCLQTGLKAGWLHLSMKTLVDLTKFVGVIDWKSLKRMSELADWASIAPEKSAVAYVVRDNAFGAIIKVISALFGRTRHRAFSGRPEAIAWLAG
ncbi:MAG: hypothetical protein H6924_05630 [Alphaproteobacteria bacterium]|nr:hypothetical protein [Alphaproteobacteria bacterium]